MSTLFASTQQATQQLWKPVVETLTMICDRFGGNVHVSLAIRAKPSHFVVRLISETSLTQTERFWCILGHEHHDGDGYRYQLLQGGPATLGEIGDALTSDDDAGDPSWIYGNITVEPRIQP